MKKYIKEIEAEQLQMLKDLREDCSRHQLNCIRLRYERVGGHVDTLIRLGRLSINEITRLQDGQAQIDMKIWYVSQLVRLRRLRR